MKASLRLLFLLLMISAGVSAQTGPRRAYAVGDTLIGYTAEGEAFKAKVINGNDNVNGKGNWYTLDGQRLNSQPTQKGIYINNGKKIVIK